MSKAQTAERGREVNRKLQPSDISALVRTSLDALGEQRRFLICEISTRINQLLNNGVSFCLAFQMPVKSQKHHLRMSKITNFISPNYHIQICLKG